MKGQFLRTKVLGNGWKTSGGRTHHPKQAQIWGDNGRQEEIRPRESGQTNTDTHIGGHNIQQKETRSETMGDKAQR